MEARTIAEAQEQLVMVVTVRLTSGEGRSHSIPVSADQEECLHEWRAVTHAVRVAIDNGSSLLLVEPAAVYNGRHISAIDFNFIGNGDIVERVRAAQRSVGFQTQTAA